MSIPTEAVEAAARALRRAAINDQVTAFPISFHERHALAALTAAAPFIQAAAKAEALREAAEYIGQCIDIGADADSSPQDTMAWLRARAASIEGRENE